MLESLLNNVATLLERNFISNFIFKGTYFVDHLRSAAAVIIFPDAAFLKIKFISHNLPNQKRARYPVFDALLDYFCL